ncbi:tRNA delta(2)-isopentenylpyrophosphate transferase [Pseudopedobacter saltans DSM 12145]|uniref:tRNA dimethylallyltransferase n=1 Tax=Pseudopedobacter saltans (strain ATCC 51119 / DSM 12145 / JCM 21818 / CCUG 39354 / LMG 10337 / NBRC 100064 / NCIMB 13643) TaxID=762903 RepID=F0SCH6_PSESL|nr:tRNA (adenosine(37)-N6)-dimethylallyltransferase MiaA [Pseudopedobacter saltans]ADY52810.1 tRNA delta(2)-isopentenylpyrophosphate transferase [Pseudopedobacter saltans DSM 12145]
MPKTLIVIAGPTAVGKTALGIEIAKHYQTEVLSADSRQFFKETTIGTAKPSKEELSTVKHYFIDSHSVTEDFSVGHYEKQALEILQNIFATNDYAVMVGGSGLYVNAVINGFDELPEIDIEVRNTLNQRLEEEGILKLQEELKEIDPVYYHTVDLNNPQRIIRALEVYHSSSQVFSSFRTGVKRERPFKTVIIGLNMEREKLYGRINKRVDIMLEQGLLEEVKSLSSYQKLNSLNTVGYTEIFDYLNGNINLERAIELIKQNSRRYAKRQITWFKKVEGIKWFDPKQKEDIILYIDKTISS